MVGRRCVFFDRDGVLNEAPPPGEYVLSWDELRVIPAAIDWIRLCKALGFLVIVVTNQRCVARGLISPAELDELHERLQATLREAGAALDDIFVCPHEIGVCDCRKPLPGLVRQAQQKWNLSLPGSLLIGDSETDRQLARHCGLRFAHVAAGRILSLTDLELAAAEA